MGKGQDVHEVSLDGLGIRFSSAGDPKPSSTGMPWQLKAFLLLLVPLAILLILRPGLLDDTFSEGNRYRDGTVAVRAIDARTRQPMETFQTTVIYGDRNPDPAFNEVHSNGFDGAATLAITYPTFHYRHAGRPNGFAFFGDYTLEVSAEGYRTTRVRFPRFVVQHGQFPPKILPPVVVELQKDRDD